jgi:nitroreductase
MKRRDVLIGGGALAVVATAATYVTAAQMGSATDYDDVVSATRKALPESLEMRDLLRYATLAPNGHNAQPWLFRASEGRIDILPDFARRTPVVDPDDHHLFISLGCAAENLALASAARGRAGAFAFDSSANGSIAFNFAAGPPVASVLFDAIPKRQSTRAVYDGRAVSAADLKLLAAAAAIPGVDLVLITDRPQIDRVRDLVVKGNDTQMADAAFMRELKSWLRFNPREAARTGDGLYSAASGSPSMPDWLGPRAFDWFVTAKSERDRYAGHLNSSSGIAAFVGAKEDREHWFLVGRACQRFALRATAIGLKHAFVNQPVEVPRLRPELAALIGMPGRRPDIVMRFGHGPTLPYSPRRPIASVMVT